MDEDNSLGEFNALEDLARELVISSGMESNVPAHYNKYYINGIWDYAALGRDLASEVELRNGQYYWRNR
jgi:hypothetical protein